MQGSMAKLIGLQNLWDSEARSFCIGQIVQITKEGQALVDYHGNLMGPIKARSIIDAVSQHDNRCMGSIPVLLVFENGDPTLPIIVGIIRDKLYPPFPSDEVALPMERPHDAILDGKKMVFDAKEEIVLQCGKSSVTLRKDGKIVVKGTRIISRSSGTNKIRGANVMIN